jgi:hypothetical protein
LIVTGSAAVQAVLSAYQSAAREHASTKGWEVSADAIYAAGIESGRRKSGRLARAADGLFFMRNALEQVAHSSEVQTLIAQGLPDHPDQLRGARQRVANAVAKRARAIITPFPYSPRSRRHTGELARSIRVHREGEGQTVIAPLVRAVARRRRR